MDLFPGEGGMVWEVYNELSTSCNKVNTSILPATANNTHTHA